MPRGARRVPAPAGYCLSSAAWEWSDRCSGTQGGEVLTGFLRNTQVNRLTTKHRNNRRRYSKHNDSCVCCEDEEFGLNFQTVQFHLNQNDRCVTFPGSWSEPRSDQNRWTQSEPRFKILFIVTQPKHQRCSVERNYKHGSI